MEEEQYQENLDSENEGEDAVVDLDELFDEDNEEDKAEDEAEKYRKLYEDEKRKSSQLYARLKKGDKEPEKKKAPQKLATDDDIRRVLEERDLEEMELSDSLKTEVADYARMKGISVRKAIQAPYIQFRKEQEDKKREAEEASLGSKGRPSAKKDLSAMQPQDFDLSTEQGRTDFVKYEDYLRKQLG